jgi:hypothetical protein
MAHDLSGLQRLAVRRNQVLAALSVLSDAACSQWVGYRDAKGKAKGNKSESKEPTSAGGSLYVQWRETFDVDWPDVPDDPDQAALDWCYDRAYRLVMQAEADLHWATGKLDTTTTGDPVARDKRIVKAYEGRPAVEVAHLERCSTASVRAIRRQFGRDPLTGRQTTRGKR